MKNIQQLKLTLMHLIFHNRKVLRNEMLLLAYQNNSVVNHTVKTKVFVFLLLNPLLADAQLVTLVFNVK